MKYCIPSRLLVGLVLLFLMALGNDPISAVQSLYWCPNKPMDQQYAASPQPGCTPLVEEDDQKKETDRTRERASIKVEHLQSEVTGFLRRYRQFLECCAAKEDTLEELETLEGRASDLLGTVQKALFSEQMKLRGFTFSELIPPLAKAYRDLGKLKKRLAALAEAKERLGTLDYESAGRARRRIQEEEESLGREFRSVAPPESARTGGDIADTTLPNRVGTELSGTSDGTRGRIGGDIGRSTLTPKTGPESVDTTLPSRTGSDIEQTTLPNSTGFQAGTADGPTGPSTNPTRVGPGIADSPLNHR